MNVLVPFLISFFIVSAAHAEIILSPGVSITNEHSSEETNLAGKELVKFKPAMGISIDAEWTFLSDSVSIFSGVIWRGSEAETQYSYTNPQNPFDTASIADLKTNSSSLSGFVGPRFRFINLKYFKIFAGAGWNPGILYLTYNESKFLLANGSIVGFKEKEDQRTQGTYFELGFELYSTKGGAIRLLGRQVQQKSDRFQTLGNKRINLSTTSAAIQYMHIF